MRVKCEVSETELEGDHGAMEAIEATCGRCGHATQSFGTSGTSIRRCLALMREECPKGETNFYVDEDGGDGD